MHVLVYMLDHVQTGTVVLREPDGGHHLVYFQDGAPSKVRVGKPLALLGEQLVANGAATSETIAMAIESSRRMDTLLGEFLVDSGLLSHEVLAQELATQVGSKIAALVNLPPETDYAFYGVVNLLDSWAGGELSPCHPLNAILASVRAWHDRARIRATLGRISKQPLAFHPETDLSVLLLTREEQSVLDAIAATRSTITTLYQQRLTDEEVVSTLVYTLAVTRCFGFTTAKGPPMTSPAFARSALAVAPTYAGGGGQATSLPPLSLGVVSTERPPVAVVSQPAGQVPSFAPPAADAPPSARSASAWRPARVPAAEVVRPGARPVPEPARMGDTSPSPGMHLHTHSVKRPNPSETRCNRHRLRTRRRRRQRRMSKSPGSPKTKPSARSRRWPTSARRIPPCRGTI